MNRIVTNLHNLGVRYTYTEFEKRRVRLINLSATTVVIIIIVSITANLIIKDYLHAFRMFCGMILLSVPVYYLNHKGKLRFARIYLTLFTICLANFIGYASLLSGENRFNEYLLFGAAAFVLVLFDGRMKKLIYVFTGLSALLMHSVRYVNINLAFDADLYLALINMSIAFVCVYLFISIFRSQIEKNSQRISDDALQLKSQKEIIEEKTFALRAMLNNVPIFMGLLDPDGKYLVVNSRYSYAYQTDIENIEGKYAYEFLSNKMNALHQGYISRAKEGLETEFNREVIINTGEKFHLYGKMIPLLDENNNIKALVEYGSDVTELKEAEAELRLLNESKDKLLGIVSHDLKSPLNSLSSLLSISDDLKPDEFKKMIHQIRNRTQLVSFTMDNLLAWVKTQLLGFTTDKEEVNICSKFTEAIKLYNSKLISKNLTVKNKLPESININCDPNHLSLVCRNLISNAIKFTPIGGAIDIDVNVSKQQIEFSVSDTGVGMDQRQIKNVLKNQVNETTVGTTGELGTGLGLGFCVDILKRNNAHLHIESELQKGTTIKIVFERVE